MKHPTASSINMLSSASLDSILSKENHHRVVNTWQATVSFDASGRLLVFIQVRFLVIQQKLNRNSLGGLRLCGLRSTHWFQWKCTGSTCPYGAQTQTHPVYYGVGLWSLLVWIPYFVSYRVSLWLILWLDKASSFQLLLTWVLCVLLGRIARVLLWKQRWQ